VELSWHNEISLSSRFDFFNSLFSENEKAQPLNGCRVSIKQKRVNTLQQASTVSVGVDRVNLNIVENFKLYEHVG
jgi:hypothetical protein